MSRCDYNTLFYRVLCATLLVTAFTFTVILTNVFIDVDGLLSNKNKHDSQIDFTKTPTNDYNGDGTEDVLDDDKSYEVENDPFYRTRRSISNIDNGRGSRAHDEANNIQLHVKDPGLKKILTSRLTSLLKELDEEETMTDNIKTEPTTVAAVTTIKDIHARDNAIVRNNDLFHLAMHNILLQGILGHMDLNDVYNKIHLLVDHFNTGIDKDTSAKILNSIVNSKEITGKINAKPYNEETKLFEELIKCKKLESDIARNKLSNTKHTTTDDVIKKDDNIYIKAIIEINEGNGKRIKNNFTNSTDNIEGVIKLIYNGKPVKLKPISDIKYNTPKNNKTKQYVGLKMEVGESKNNEESQHNKSESSFKKEHNQNYLLNKLIEEYFKTHPTDNIDHIDNREIIRNKFKRLKRQIKIRYDDDDTINSGPSSTPKNDDDVYIEIETHFDGKGIKHDKKRKLVRNLIDKIQKALRSDIEETNDIAKHIKFIKRTQDPIDGNKHTLTNKISPPHDRIEPRQLDPIDKTLNTHENLIKEIDESWINQIESPKFLSITKSVNSAEMRELNINYDNVLKNGIPKRLQKPINTDLKEDIQTTAPYVGNDNGNVTLLLKDIDGTGFSIGINQYVGEPPDISSMNMFNGLENLIKEYHQTYDQDVSNESDIDKAENFVHLKNNKKIRNGHNILKRSLNEFDNASKYKIFSNNKLSFDKYLKAYMYEYDKTLFKPKKYLNKTNTIKTNDRRIYSLLKMFKLRGAAKYLKNQNKKLTSSEILTSANLINRKKRSLTIKKISNVNSKMKLSKYINTRGRTSTRILLNKKRNKRQINKIRIITHDAQNPQKNSEENIFLISRENTYADKETVIKDFETADTVMDPRGIYSIGDIYRIHHEPRPVFTNYYDTKRTSNRLMSKYPHIFFDDNNASKEDDSATDNAYDINKMPYGIHSMQNRFDQEFATTETITTVSSENSIPKVEEIINAIMPSASKPNYKVTLRITPKNMLNITTGFKEVHTSVNKSFDENGLRYFSLFNLSQISKIEELNKTTDPIQEKIHINTNKNNVSIEPIKKRMNEQQMQIKTLLQLHKKRVDQQLSYLIKESKHLERMIDVDGKNNTSNTINILQDDIVTTDRTNEDKINKILSSIKDLQESYNLIKNTIKDQTNTVPDKPRTVSDTPVVIRTVKSNDKLANEILKKVDTNTNILKTFLERFSDNLKYDRKEAIVAPRIPTTSNPAEIKINLSKDRRRYIKNAYYVPGDNRNVSKQFLYAYQHNKEPLANIYTGHSLSNDIQNDRKPASNIQPNELENLETSKQNFNESKFFMDEIVNDFKMIPNKPFINPIQSINTTKV